jgi:hypothetical protein
MKTKTITNITTHHWEAADSCRVLPGNWQLQAVADLEYIQEAIDNLSAESWVLVDRKLVDRKLVDRKLVDRKLVDRKLQVPELKRLDIQQMVKLSHNSAFSRKLLASYKTVNAFQLSVNKLPAILQYLD